MIPDKAVAFFLKEISLPAIILIAGFWLLLKRKRLGIREMALERARKEGLHKGMIKGKAEGIAEGKAEVVKNLITKMGFTDAQAADVVEVSIDFVKKIRRKLNK